MRASLEQVPREDVHRVVGADPGGEFLREKLVAALAVIDFGLGPIFLQASPFHSREQRKIALPLGRHAGFGDEIGDERALSDLRRIDGHDLVGHRDQIELPRVGALPRRVGEDRFCIAADLLEKLAERNFEGVPPALRADILRYYGGGGGRLPSADDDEDADETRRMLGRLEAAKATR